MKDELGGEIMIEFVGLRPKCYVYLTDENKVDERAKRTKKMCDKRYDILMCDILINDYKKCLKEKKKIIKI